MFDFAKTIELIRGGLMEPQATWEKYLGENPDLQKTFFLLAAPLIVAQAIFGAIFSRMIGGFSMYGWGHGWFMAIIITLVMGLISLAIVTVVINLLAGVFGGKSNWNRAFAAVTLALIPGYVGGIIGGLIPWLGALIVFAGFVFSVIFLYRILPLALDIPDGKRPLHFIVSIVCIFVANMIIGTVLGFGAAGSQFNKGFDSAGYSRSDDSDDNGSSGVFNQFERQGKIMEDAENDRFDPPDNGKVSAAQVKALVRVMEKTEKLQNRHEEKLEEWAKEIDKKEQPSFSDLGKMFQGVGGAVGAFNAEMEVVKTGGGNWAEHQWVKEQLRIAIIQEDTSDAVKHNFELYQQYQEKLDEFM